MASTFRTRAKFVARLVAPILFATALNACSSIPDWVDPTTWVGGDSQASSDQTGGAAADETATTGQQAASNPSSAAGQTPDIAAIPPKPAPPSTADEQKQVADSLAADRAQAHYSADALRGGTEAAAAPPAPVEPAAPPASTSSSTAADTAVTGQTDNAATATAADQSGANASSSPDTGASAMASAAPPAGDEAASSAQTPSQPAASPSPATNAAPETPAPASSEVASADTASVSAPAAAPMAAETGTPPSSAAPDMQASFAPSKAPALDPSVSQFVPQQILSRYQETAAAAAIPADSVAPVKHHRHRKKTKSSQFVVRHHYRLAGFFRDTSLKSLRYARKESRSSVLPMRSAALRNASYQLDSSLFSVPESRGALAVVAFARETTILDRGARSRIQSAARIFVAQGGTGYVRVVGRASDFSSDVPRAVGLRNNFERSEAQATAVARELIRDGVPPQKVLVEAVGDTPAAGHTAMQASRSAEIFLQS